MNKKGDKNDIVMSTVIYLVLLLMFVIPLSMFVFGQVNGAGIWQDFYAKEISRVVNLADVGDEIVLDVHKGSVIGIENGVESFSDMFRFNSKDKEICVRFSNSKRTCYGYFNDVSISNAGLVLAGDESGEKNVLKFSVVERSSENDVSGGELDE